MDGDDDGEKGLIGGEADVGGTAAIFDDARGQTAPFADVR